MDTGISREELDLEVMAARAEDLVKEPAIGQKGTVGPDPNARIPELPSGLEQLEEVASEERFAAGEGDALVRLGTGAHCREDLGLAPGRETASSNRTVPALQIAPGTYEDLMKRNHGGDRDAQCVKSRGVKQSRVLPAAHSVALRRWRRHGFRLASLLSAIS
jgi:hypothetical protein